MRIVVSGGTKGIGRSIVEIFAANGFDVALCSRNATDLNKLKTYLEAKYGIEVLVKVADVSIKQELLDFAATVKKEWDKIDVVVNNAGIYRAGLLHEEEDGVLEKMINTNLYSAYHLSRAFIPGMKKLKSGYIFNISSIAGKEICENTGAYGVSKFAMTGLNKALRAELMHFGIKVTAVIPGATLTASWEGEDYSEDRLIPANDIAQLVWNCFNLSKQTVVEEIVVRPQMGDL
ncbi:MAG: SDR family oxidoreductase [Chitinophagales bacterium]